MHVFEDTAPISGALGTGSWAKPFNVLLYQALIPKLVLGFCGCDEAWLKTFNVLEA